MEFLFTPKKKNIANVHSTTYHYRISSWGTSSRLLVGVQAPYDNHNKAWWLIGYLPGLMLIPIRQWIAKNWRMMSYKRKGWINGTDVDIVFSQIAVVSYSHSVEEPNPYIESSHNRSLSWTPLLCYCSHCNDKVSISRRVSFLKKSKLSCERSSMNGMGDGGNLILHLFGRAVGSAGTLILFCSRHHLFVRVSCEFAGSTCCNLHAEYAGVCSLEASMVKRAIRESGAGNMKWRFENDARHPW